MPGLGKAQQVLVMMTLWAGTLILVDKKFNDHPERAKSAKLSGTPQITLTINHLCCGGCYEDLFQALKTSSWLSNPVILNRELPLPTRKEADIKAPPPTPPPHSAPNLFAPPVVQAISMDSALDSAMYSGTSRVDLDRNRIVMADLMLVESAIASSGLVDSKMVLTGIPHFQLKFTLRHFCCGTCSEAVTRAFEASKEHPVSPAMLQLQLINTPLVDKIGHTVTLEYRNQADVSAAIALLRKIGFNPLAIKITPLA